MELVPADSLSEALLEELYRLSYHGLEHCVRKLLSDIGYQSVVILGRKHRHQRTNHGGFDMSAVSEIGLTKGSVVIQIKQYRRPVSRRFVDELRGAMMRRDVRHGILITLSTFSKPAREAARRSHIAPIRLVEGVELANLMVLKRIGSREDPAGDLVLDTGFFAAVRNAYLNSKTPNKPTNSANTPQLKGGEGSRRFEGGPMMFRTHALFALSSLWLLAAVTPGLTSENVGVLSAAVFGAMLPDLDASASTIRSLSVGGVQPFAPLSGVVYRAWRHRGPLHSLPGLAGIGVMSLLLVSWWGWPLSAALFLGYASHLAADACTRSGIPLWPGSPSRIYLLPRRLRFATGSAAEDLLFPFLVAAVFLLLLTHLPYR